MRTPHTRWAPDDLNSSGGAEPNVSPEKSTRADRERPTVKDKTPPVTETSGQRISGPGPNDLTRGLP